MKTAKVGDKFIEVVSRERTVTEVIDSNPFAETTTVKDEEGRTMVIRTANKRRLGADFMVVMELDTETK